MRQVGLLSLVVMLASCNRQSPSASKPAPSDGLTLEQRRELALAVPAGESELSRAAAAARQSPTLADRWVTLGQFWVRQARVSNERSQYLSAEAAAEVALSLQPELSSALALKAIVALNQHRFAQARELATAALERRNDDLLALAALADATLELGDLEASIAAVQKMVDLKPNLPSYGRAAHLRWLRGDSSGAKTLYRQALDSGNNPRDPEPQAWMAVQLSLIFLDEGDVDGAEAGFTFATSRAPNYPPALVGQARVLLARNDAAVAVSLLERAVEVSPLVETWVLLAEARLAAKDDTGATAAWARAEQLGRENNPLALARGWAEAGASRAAEAVRLLEAERAVRPNAQVDVALGLAQLRAGDIAAARAASERALVVGPGDVRSRALRALVLEANGNRRGALTELDALKPRLAALSPSLRQELEARRTALSNQLAAR